MSDTIAVCCGTPLIWTFINPGSEWFCRKCKKSYPMFGVEKEHLTPRLARERDENEEWFKSIVAGYIPPGAKLRGCEKCEEGEYHRAHATPKEKEKSDLAYKQLYS